MRHNKSLRGTCKKQHACEFNHYFEEMEKKEEIIKNAQNHLIENPHPYDEYEWVLKDDFIELEDEVYFNYCFQHKKSDLPPEQWEMFAGAPGFCINKKTGKGRDLSWDEYHNIMNKR